jgi:hypothetical protein
LRDLTYNHPSARVPGRNLGTSEFEVFSMRVITPAIGALLVAWLGSPVLSQSLSDLQTRDISACTADGDSEAFANANLK